MSRLKFNLEEIKSLISKLPDYAKLTLVGDQGIYIMSFAQDAETRDLVYAEGTNPEKDEDWYDTKHELFGGDDGGDDIGDVKSVKEILEVCKTKYLFIDLTSTSMSITNV